ncbi:MAG: hypothetical protein K2O78_03480 [Muribaculaceae bacterium]|nr:hypothetical protein [Muribaculaceae bacterium]MDE7080697.1 hypothetical protein [Muribaculaceae bacterium]
MCTENKTEKIYLVSFGNSEKYLLRDNEAGEKSILTRLEAELNSYLRSRFPDETFAYYTTPRVDEVPASEIGKYIGYPELDAQAVAGIKEVLAREVEDMQSTSEINDNAPYANVNPAAADIRHILG